MKESKKKTGLLTEMTENRSGSYLSDEKKTAFERLKKPLIFTLGENCRAPAACI
ncbi:hypothetical protein ACFFWB_22705 [Flavobacterium procerum]|uniref:hypothetical protein n=1 Tax=Flavobacterium procerum TaxID=1455569 RepID=UPI0035EF8C9D